MRRTTVVLAFGLLLLTFSSHAIGGARKPSPPQSSAYGHTLAEWLKLYYTWALGGPQANPEGQVYFLPVPAGAEVQQFSGTGTPDDPAVLVGHKEVQVKPGTPFVLPIVGWLGESYAPDGQFVCNPDPEVPKSVFEASDILITLDGKPIIDSSKEDKFRYYVSPQYFDAPIVYQAPTSYGSIAANFIQSFVFVHPPLSKGTHILTLSSSLIIPGGNVYCNTPGGLGLVFYNTWTITVKP